MKEEKMFAYVNGIILDGSADMQPQTGKAILVEDEEIVGIVPLNEVSNDYELIDLEGQYIMPGLVNLHVHLPGSGKPKKKPTDTKKLVKLITSCGLGKAVLRLMLKKYAQTELFSGVTTLRTVGGVQDSDSKMRDRINTGKLVGPRILSSDMAVSVPGGHMAGSLAYEATSAEEAAEFVKIIASGKPDWIKLMITGGVLDAKAKGEPGELKMPLEYVQAACETAHALGFKVCAHVESPEGVRVALKGGVDSIEHGAQPDEEIIRLFKENNAYHVATLSPALPYALFDPSISHVSEMEQYNGNVVFQGIIDCARACLAAGVPVGLGTDTGCPFITHYDMWREVNYFVKYCGVTPAFALYTATKLNAQIAGVGDVTGSIEPGKSADMIVCRENPLESITALRDLSMVIIRGKKLKKIAIKKMAKVETELDKFL